MTNELFVWTLKWTFFRITNLDAVFVTSVIELNRKLVSQVLALGICSVYCRPLLFALFEADDAINETNIVESWILSDFYFFLGYYVAR